MTAPGSDFEPFMHEVEPRLRGALVARYGPTDGREATAEALVFAWENWDLVRSLEQPLAYLIKVGQSRTRRIRRRLELQQLRGRPEYLDPLCEPGLKRALAALSKEQRIAVVLIHGYQWSLGEVAELRGTTKATTQTHLSRGMKRLRAQIDPARPVVRAISKENRI